MPFSCTFLPNQALLNNFYVPEYPLNTGFTITWPANISDDEAKVIVDKFAAKVNGNTINKRIATLKNSSIVLTDTPTLVRTSLRMTVPQLEFYINRVEDLIATHSTDRKAIPVAALEVRMAKDEFMSYVDEYTSRSFFELKVRWLEELNEAMRALIAGERGSLTVSVNSATLGLLVKLPQDRVNPNNNYNRINLATANKDSIKRMYKFSSALQPTPKKVNDTPNSDLLEAINVIRNNADSNTPITIYKEVIKPVVKEVDTTKKQVTLFSLSPNLRKSVKELRAFIAARYQYFSEPFANGYETGYIYEVFDKFNVLKTDLMLLGYSETKVVKMIINLCFKNKRKQTAPKDVVTCLITDQLLPKILCFPLEMLDGRKGYGSMKYILYSNNQARNTRSGQGRWSQETTQFKEIKLNADQVYSSDVLNYQSKTQFFLTPRSVQGENTKTLGKGAKYTPQPWLGVELEVERALECAENITELSYAALGRDFVMFKTDGSLGGVKPFEIVTVPATLNYHKARWENFLSNTELKTNLQSYKSGKCGMHVHISRDSFNGLHLAKFMRFINMGDNYRFIADVAQRKENHYCQYTRYTNIPQASKALWRGARGAINTNLPNTVEVRIFRGNLSKHAFYKNLEFVHAAWAYTKDASMRELGYKDFLFWLHNPKNMHDKLYANLQKWAIANNYNVSNITVSRDETPETKIKLQVKRTEARKIQTVIKRKFNSSTESETIGKGQGIIAKSVIASNH